MKIVSVVLFIALATGMVVSSLEGCLGCKRKEKKSAMVLPMVRGDMDSVPSSLSFSTVFKKIKKGIARLSPTTVKSKFLLTAAIGFAVATYLVLNGETPVSVLEQCPAVHDDFLTLIGYGAEQCSAVADKALAIVAETVQDLPNALGLLQECVCYILPKGEILCGCDLM